MLPISAALLAWSMLVLTPAAALGAELRQGDAIVVPAGETIEDDLYAFGQSVTIYGTVSGDVIAAGQSVNVAGIVTGDLMAAGGSVVVAGPVSGSARLAGQMVEISALIGRDLLAGAAMVGVGPRVPIDRDLLVGGSTITLSGPVARSIRAGAESLTIGGPVGGDVMAQVGTLRLVIGAGIVVRPVACRMSRTKRSRDERCDKDLSGMTPARSARAVAPSRAANVAESVILAKRSTDRLAFGAWMAEFLAGCTGGPWLRRPAPVLAAPVRHAVAAGRCVARPVTDTG